jgi:DNA-binding MarR family transcriptional regulator
VDEERRALIEAVGAALRGSQQAADALADAVADRFGINRTDLRHLELLCAGPLSAGQLSERSGLSRAAMTALIDRLERKGYVRRARDVTDRRRVFVELTERAKAAAQEMHAPLAEDGKALLAGYTDAQLTVLREFLAADQTLSERHHERIRPPCPQAS